LHDAMQILEGSQPAKELEESVQNGEVEAEEEQDGGEEQVEAEEFVRTEVVEPEAKEIEAVDEGAGVMAEETAGDAAQ